jgi:hypothetical protein
MAGQVFSKEKKAQIKSELEDLLSSYSGNPNAAHEDIVDDQLHEIQQAPPIDFAEMNAKFESQAKSITDSLFKFYVDLGVIDRHEYFKHKQALDNANISNIFFQLNTIKMAIEKIAEEINQGNTHPRLFEVFGQLQDKLSAVVKTQANYLLFLEDTYKKAKHEVELKEGGTQGNGTAQLGNGRAQSGEYFVTAGTKNLVKAIDVEPLEIEEHEVRHLTHPAKKIQVMQERGLDNLISAESEEDETLSTDDIDDLI